MFQVIRILDDMDVLARRGGWLQVRARGSGRPSRNTGGITRIARDRSARLRKYVVHEAHRIPEHKHYRRRMSGHHAT